MKHQKLIKVKEPHTRNNGDIEIVPIEGRFTNVKHAPEEIVSQGLRYQVPEQVVIADFWTKLRRDRYGQPLETASTRGETPQTSETFDFSDSSSLTSMEASPEPQSTELPEVTSNGNAEADGAELLWLFAQQQSAREGTEVSRFFRSQFTGEALLTIVAHRCLMATRRILVHGKRRRKRQVGKNPMKWTWTTRQLPPVKPAMRSQRRYRRHHKVSNRTIVNGLKCHRVAYRALCGFGADWK